MFIPFLSEVNVVQMLKVFSGVVGMNEVWIIKPLLCTFYREKKHRANSNHSIKFVKLEQSYPGIDNILTSRGCKNVSILS